MKRKEIEVSTEQYTKREKIEESSPQQAEFKTDPLLAKHDELRAILYADDVKSRSKKGLLSEEELKQLYIITMPTEEEVIDLVEDRLESLSKKELKILNILYKTVFKIPTPSSDFKEAKDFKELITLLRVGRESPDLLFKAGIGYLHGFCGEQNKELGVCELQRSFDMHKNLRSGLWLGLWFTYMLSPNELTSANVLPYLKIAADAGNMEAQYQLAEIHLPGTPEHFYWHNAAAEQGHHQSQLKLSSLFASPHESMRENIGGKHDLKESFRFFCLAKDQRERGSVKDKTKYEWHESAVHGYGV